MYADSLGHLWVGDHDQLYQFDGLVLKPVIQHINGKPFSLQLNHIQQGKNQTLWITSPAGLYSYNMATETWGHYLNGENKLANRCRHLQFDAQGNLWVGYIGGGLAYFDVQQRKFTKTIFFAQEQGQAEAGELGANFVISMHLEAPHTLWVGTRNGLYRLNTATSQFSQEGIPDPLKGNFVRALGADGYGRLWIAHGLHRYHYTFKTKTFTPLANTNLEPLGGFTDMRQDAQGNLWFAVFNQGLYCLAANGNITQYQHHENVPGTLHSNYIKQLVTGPNGLLWMVCDYGLAYLPPNSQHIQRYMPSTDNPMVYAMQVSPGGNLWLGNGEGLFSHTLGTEGYTQYTAENSSLPQTDIWYLGGGPGNTLWVGTGEGSVVAPSQEQAGPYSFSPIPHASRQPNLNHYVPRALFTDRSQNLWMGWDVAFYRYNTVADTITEIDVSAVQDPASTHRVAESILQDAEGNIWFGSIFGLNRIDSATGQIHNYKLETDQGQKNNAVSIAIDEEGNIWAGAYNEVAVWQRSSNTYLEHPLPQPLKGRVEALMFDAHNNLWLFNEEGLYRYTPKTGAMYAFGAQDGVLPNPNARSNGKEGSGHMYMGTSKGGYRFHPDSLVLNLTPPKVAITGLRLFNQRVPIADSTVLPQAIQYLDQLTLGPEDDIFSLEFTAQDYHNAHLNQYAYKLEGFQESWIYTDARHREATFTNLYEGTYTFRVKASNHHGVWNEEGATLTIVVLPPWWRTWWAKTLWVLLVVGSLLAIYILRVSSLQRQKQKLAQEVARQTKALREQNEEILQQKEEIETQKEEIEGQAAVLRQTNEQLVELDRFKQAMSGMLVHDLKNPLNAVIGLSGVQQQPSAHEMRRIHQAGKNMLNLVTNILEVQKMEEAQAPIVLEVVQLTHLLQRIIEEVSLLLEEKELKLELEIPDTLYVEADLDLLGRVYMNLLTNAIKFTPNGGQIVLGHHLLEKERVKLWVRDTGPGLPFGVQDQIFDKFSQAQKINSGRARSTGLGLAFCRLAIEAHGGQIGVTSQVGQGASFWFTLAWVQPTAQGKPSQAQRLAEATQNAVPALEKAEKEWLAPQLEELQRLEVYKVGPALKVLESINTSGNPGVAAWVKALRNAIYSGNNTLYDKLLN